MGLAVRTLPRIRTRSAYGTIRGTAVIVVGVVLTAGLCAAPAVAAGIGLGIVRSPNPHGSQGSYLDGVSCSSSSDCVAVGYYVDSSGVKKALGEVFEGGGWGVTPMVLPSGTTSSDLYKVSCSALTACMAVGKYDTSTAIDQPLAEFWNGETWLLNLPVPNASGGRVLNAVSCDSSGDCVAVGADSANGSGAAVAEQWTGTAWQALTVAAPPGQFANLWGVSCVTSTSCEAVGEYGDSSGIEVTLAENWNGGRWAITKSYNHPGADANYLYGVTCTSSTACLAVGSEGASPGMAVPLAETYNGRRWLNVRVPAPAKKTYSLLVGIACASATSCMSVGDDAGPGSNGRAFAESWDGTKFTMAKVANPHGSNGSDLSGADCTTGGQCTFAGGYSALTSVDRTLVEVATLPL